MPQKLTDTLVKRLPLPGAGNRIEYDTDIKGFGCRVTAGDVPVVHPQLHDARRPRTPIYDRAMAGVEGRRGTGRKLVTSRSASIVAKIR